MILQYSQFQNPNAYQAYCNTFKKILHYEEHREDRSVYQFITNFKSIKDYKVIIFELQGTPDDFIQTIDFIRNFTGATVVIFALDEPRNIRFITELNKKHIRNIKLFKDINTVDFAFELENFLTGNMADSQANNNLNKQKAMLEITKSIMVKKETNIPQLPSDIHLRIAVSGTQKRIGTTTQCFVLYHYYKLMGGNPILVVSEEVIESLMQYYNDEYSIDGSVVIIKGMVMAKSRQNILDYNIIIEDLSLFDCSTTDTYDLQFLVSGGKPWDLEPLANIICNNIGTDLNLIFSFIHKNEQEEIAQMVENHIIFANYTPSLFDNEVDFNIAREIHKLSMVSVI